MLTAVKFAAGVPRQPPAESPSKPREFPQTVARLFNGIHRLYRPSEPGARLPSLLMCRYAGPDARIISLAGIRIQSGSNP